MKGDGDNMNKYLDKLLYDDGDGIFAKLRRGDFTKYEEQLDLVRDFVAYARGENPSISCTSISDSLSGHLVVFLADKSRENSGIPEKVTF